MPGRYKLVFFTILGGVLLLLMMSGCSAEARLASGVKLYRTGEYSQAVTRFRKMDFENRYYRAQASFYLAMSYYKIGQAQRASAYFQRALRYGLSNPEAYFFLGQSLRMRQEYDEALAAYEEFLKHDVGNRAALNGITSCKMAQNNPVQTRFKVEINRSLSSRESDYCPTYAGNDYSTVFFSSMRGSEKKRDKNKITGQGSSIIYSAIQDGRGGWEKPVPFVGDVDPLTDDGTPSFTADGKAMYFTRCTYSDEGPSGASIMVMKKAGGRWGQPEKLTLGHDSLVFAHPAISPDGQTLYFVSDQPGGYGGKDLWKVSRRGNEWGMPENLGPDINTPADEMFPYVRNDGRLYFSSDGLPGYGGLDIFEAEWDENSGEWIVTNLGVPLNSPAHDFGIVFRGSRQEGFLSSSRGSYRGVEQIFEFELPAIEAFLKGKVTDEHDNPLKDAEVYVVGNNGLNRKTTTSDNGTFTFVLEPDANYIVMIVAEGYYNGKVSLSTYGMDESDEFERVVILKKTEPLTR
ncbi:carboxypeptidase regulatory-like domain-containing protein [Thermophagus sp. OGC60D27]|uniref:carboxypeptidase regulatory-like domain-containing protein n=1 Tax=Thermophagus sp. OGC60D27 TaxID=3458415 RepID=UPI00403771C6